MNAFVDNVLKEEESIGSDNVRRSCYRPNRHRVQDDLAAYPTEPVQTSDSPAPGENGDQATPKLCYLRQSAGTYVELSNDPCSASDIYTLRTFVLKHKSIPHFREK